MVLLKAMPQQVNQTTFDAVILNFNNWIRPIDADNVTQERYEDSIELASSVAGANTVILVTYPFTRKVDSPEAWDAIHNANHMIRRVAMNSRSKSDTSQTPTVLVLEFANFTNQLLWMNARSLGINVSDPLLVASEIDWELKDNVTTLMTRLKKAPWDRGWRIPQVCADQLNDCWPESKYGAVSGPQWKWKSRASRFPQVAKALV